MSILFDTENDWRSCCFNNPQDLTEHFIQHNLNNESQVNSRKPFDLSFESNSSEPIIPRNPVGIRNKAPLPFFLGKKNSPISSSCWPLLIQHHELFNAIKPQPLISRAGLSAQVDKRETVVEVSGGTRTNYFSFSVYNRRTKNKKET